MTTKVNFSAIFLILCLGYLIDYYDLSLFAVSRLAILKDLHVPEDQIVAVSKLFFNAQALGVFVGGILSGVWGDKIGRAFTLRLGIFVYSTAIFINVFITSIYAFAFFRFLAGVGLAGELAASIILLSELCRIQNRSAVSNTVYFFGIMGGLLTTVIVSIFNWKTLFIIGSIAGFVLLFLRKYIVDSVLFHDVKQNSLIKRGSLKLLFLKPKSCIKLFQLTLCLFPFWLIAFFINFAPEVAKGIGLIEKIDLPHCLFLFFVGSLIGTVAFTFVVKKLNSHKKILLCGFILSFFAIVLLCTIGKYSAFVFSHIYLLMGFSTGYFGIDMAFVAGNYGTNQRSTGVTMASNFGRCSLIFMNSFVPFFIQLTKSTGAGSILSALVIIFCSIFCLSFARETYDLSLDYVE